MLFSREERLLIERQTKAWLYAGRLISNEVAELIAKDVIENLGHPDRDRSRFKEVAYSGEAFRMMRERRKALILNIEEELIGYSSDFCDDVPVIRNLNALKAWAEVTA